MLLWASVACVVEVCFSGRVLPALLKCASLGECCLRCITVLLRASVACVVEVCFSGRVLPALLQCASQGECCLRS